MVGGGREKGRDSKKTVEKKRTPEMLNKVIIIIVYDPWPTG